MLTGAPAAPAADRLFILDRATLAGVAAERQDPCFVFDLGAARERFRALRAVLPERVLLAYAVKSNPGAPLLEALAGEGAWFDCASAGEVEAVVEAGRGVLPRLVLAGPGKSESDLRAGLAAGARIQVDGIEDVARLAALHAGAEPVRVSVRVSPAGGIDEAASIIGGAGPSAFGVDEEQLDDFLATVAAYPSVRVVGLQVFAASNELDAERLLANHRVALAIGERLHREHGIELDLVDLGGGLGIPYDERSPELDVESVGENLAGLLAENPWFTGRLLLEPGRWLSGPVGVYLTRVVRVKHSRGTSFAVLQGGINHLLRPLLTGQSFPVRRVTGGDGGGAVTAYTLAGPLCTSLDRLGTADLPVDLAAGDVLAFGQAGAYSVTQAMTNFLSHPEPAQVWLA